MKIKIKTEGFRMTLLFPTSLVLSNLESRSFCRSLVNILQYQKRIKKQFLRSKTMEKTMERIIAG